MSFDAIARPPAGARDGVPTVIRESSTIDMAFNTMPERPVRERLELREYRIWDRHIEAEFDREYSSSMRNSPQHLILFTALAHTQKLLYVWGCQHFGFKYESGASEQFKMWWTKTTIRMPKLVTTQRACVQWLYVDELKRLRDKKFVCRGLMGVEDGLAAAWETPIFLI
ncbi:MAG: hypothetical protein IT432_03730 [Phycisphaerales bacterium]|nr:hypothetical protein [Phycisphaerales bacterium]